MSGLQWNVKPIAFKQGLDTKTNQKLVIEGKWNRLDNLSLSDDNTPGLRDGMSSIIDYGAAGGNANSLATYNNELVCISGPTASSVSTATTTATATAVAGNVGNVLVSKSEIQRSGGTQDSLDVAYGDGFACYVWRDLTAAAACNGINCTVVDQTTGTKVLNSFVAISSATAFTPRVIYSNSGGGAFFVMYQTGANNIFCRVILTSAPSTVGAQTALVTSANLTGFNFDACAFTASSPVLLVYPWSDGVTSIRAQGFTRVGTTPQPFSIPANIISEVQQPAASISGVCCAAFDSTSAAGVFVQASAGGTFGGGLIGATVDQNILVTHGPTLLDTVVQVTPGATHVTACLDFFGNLMVFWDYRSEWALDELTNIRSVAVTTLQVNVFGPAAIIPSATFGGASRAFGPQGPFIHGKAFLSNNHVYLPVCIQENYQGLATTTTNNNQQNCFFLYDATNAIGSVPSPALPVSRALYGAFGVAGINAVPPVVSTPCSTPALPSGAVLMPCTERTLLQFSNGINVSPTGICVLTLTPNFSVAQQAVQLGQSTYIAGGDIVSYDGSAMSEQCFPLFPEGIGVTVVVGGGAMTAGVHQVVAVYEYVDGAGQRHQSAPSPAVSFTVAANGRFTISIPTLLVSMKSTIATTTQTVSIVLYLTVAAGTTFFRITSIALPTLNSTSANRVTLTNLNPGADTAFSGNEILYSQPDNPSTSTLPNNAPAPCSMLMVHQNRLWFDKADQPLAFGYSQQYFQGLGLQFNETLGGILPSASGGLVGMASMDDKAILFTASRPFVIYGTGPTASGGFSNYSDPIGIASDVGCSSRQSILSTPHGIIFKSPKGWYMLGRGLDVTFIGSGVAMYDGNDVTSATMLGNEQECRFTSSSGVTLVFSYDVDGSYQWSTSTRQIPLGASDALYWATISRFVMCAPAMGVVRDTPGIYLDDYAGNTYGISWGARTAFLKLDVLERFQRVRELYLTMTATGNPAAMSDTLQLTVDFDDAYSGSPGAYAQTINMSTLAAALAPGQPIDIRHSLRRQKCKSVAFTFVDVSDGSGGVQLLGLQALALEVGIKRGQNKLSAAQTVE